LALLLFKCRWRHCWHADTCGQLTKNIYQLDKYFYRLVNSCLCCAFLCQHRNPKKNGSKLITCGKLCAIFSGTPCITHCDSSPHKHSISKQYIKDFLLDMYMLKLKYIANCQTTNTGQHTIVLAKDEIVHAAKSKHIEEVPWCWAYPTLTNRSVLL